MEERADGSDFLPAEDCIGEFLGVRNATFGDHFVSVLRGGSHVHREKVSGWLENTFYVLRSEERFVGR